MWNMLANVFASIEKLSLDQFRLAAGLLGITMCISSIVASFAIPISPYAFETFPLFRFFVCAFGIVSGSGIIWYSLSTKRVKRMNVARLSFRSVSIACVFYSAMTILRDIPNSLTFTHLIAGFTIAILLSIPVAIVVEKLLQIAINLDTDKNTQI